MSLFGFRTSVSFPSFSYLFHGEPVGVLGASTHLSHFHWPFDEWVGEVVFDEREAVVAVVPLVFAI